VPISRKTKLLCVLFVAVAVSMQGCLACFALQPGASDPDPGTVDTAVALLPTLDIRDGGDSTQSIQSETRTSEEDQSEVLALAYPAPQNENEDEHEYKNDHDDDSAKLSSTTSMTAEEANFKIDGLTRQILLKQIELERFNLRYTSEVAKQGRWKGWRYAGLQEANTGLGLAGAIISVAYRGARLGNAGAVKPCIQQAANYVPMIGTIIGGSAAALEFGINQYHDLVARRHGFAPTMAVKHVNGIKSDINRMLDERDLALQIEAASPKFASHAKVDTVEGLILKDLRDLSLQEFERFHLGARRLYAFQQAQYFFDLAKYTTNAIGYDFAYLSLHRGRRLWNGRAGVLFTVSGALTMFAPVLSRGFALGVEELHRRKLAPVMRDVQKDRLATLEKDLGMINALAEQDSISPDAIERATNRLGMYGTHQKTFADEIRRGQEKNASAKLTATQNIGAGMYVGGTKLASGVLFMIPGFNRHYNTTGERANRVTNDLLFTASLIAIPSSAFSMADTLRIQIKGEINRHRQKKAGMLPGQIIADRLKQLEDMEANLKANTPKLR